jgi:phage/plasmid-associated DNA primase
VDLINDSKYVPPSKELQEYYEAVEDADRLWKITNDGPQGNNPLNYCVEMITLLVITEHMVSKFDIVRHMKNICSKYNIEISFIDDAILTVWNDIDKFQWIKNISYFLGKKGHLVKFDKTQVIEAAEWIKGNNHIKRIELTGDLLQFNGSFYERNAEALIRRQARQIIEKCPTKDVTEVVRYIEDTCTVITWRDIEHSIHIKCLSNGLYDIKSGLFSSKFDPEYIILNQIPHNYVEEYNFDDIENTVKTIIEDPQARQSFYDFISTCLHPYTGVDYQFGCVGVSGTGKSQLGELVKSVLGHENCSDTKIHDLANDQTMQKSAAFKMLNYDDDLNDQSIRQIDVIKKWVTQSEFTARGIYEQPTTFRPMSRLMFSANDLYEIPNADDAEAIYDRTYLVRIDKKYRHRDGEIKNVMKKVATDEQLDGFLTYLLQNAFWIANEEKYHHPISLSTVESIWNTLGNRIKEFKKKWIVDEPSYRLDSNDPFNKWSEYCITNNYHAKSKKEFKEIFDELVGNTPTKTRKKLDGSEESVEIYAYTGIRLKTDEEIQEEEQNKIDPSESEEALKALIFLSLSLNFKTFNKIKNSMKSTELLELGEES